MAMSVRTLVFIESKTVEPDSNDTTFIGLPVAPISQIFCVTILDLSDPLFYCTKQLHKKKLAVEPGPEVTRKLSYGYLSGNLPSSSFIFIPNILPAAT